MKEPLLNKQNVKKYPEESVGQKIKRVLLGPSVQQSGRKILLAQEQVQPKNHHRNVVRNQKYNYITFLPVVLYNQFKFFFNFFFLMTSLSQFYDPLKVGFLITYLAPLLLVLGLTMLKEAYDDYQRYKRDKEANSYQYRLITGDGTQYVQSAELRVGQMVEVKANERIPADLVLLHAYDKNSSVFIRTDQLDGETDWKLRKSVRHTQEMIDKHFQGDYSQLSLNTLGPLLQEAQLKCQKPSQQIYEFQGQYSYIHQGKKEKEGLGLEHTMWANTVLASSRALGLVVYAGNETRMQMNSQTTRSKFGKLEQEINFLTKVLFLYLVVICVIMVVLRGGGWSSYTFVIFFRYVLLISSIIPISMRVNLDFAKLVYCYRINKDDKIPGTIARNSNIPEELGRAKYLLCDKTGTLTQNDMIFKRLSLEQIQFSYEDQEEMKKMIQKNTRKYNRGIMDDYFQKKAEELQQQIQYDNNNNNNTSVERIDSMNTERNSQIFSGRRHIKREKESIVRDCINALALCHNVTPVIDESTGLKTFQASSPDEIALVKTAEEMGVMLKHRTEKEIVLLNSSNQEEVYQVLAIFPFSSESKRMGIVIKQDEKIVFLLKGADVIMKNKVPEVQRGFLLDECEDLSSEGLRTLCFAYKCLQQDEFEAWEQDYKDAQQDMKNRRQKVDQCLAQLEQNMQFLCITGVEDKLQENVSQTIENLRSAGINVWMLTGDKVETAKCIAISAGLRNDSSQQMVTIKEIGDQLELKHKLDDFSNSADNAILVIDGDSLRIALTHFAQYFVEISCQAPAVVCCRCSPTQKAQITEYIKKYTKKQVAAIGDGGNDVGMIQAADLGIGIVGKEGKQAALAADFSINQYSYINRLLLWHGRNSYKRSATLGQFVIHRGLIISTIQTVFMIIFYFVTMSIYNGMLNLGYSTVFTTLPIFCLIFDQDIDENTAVSYAPLYKTLQKNRELNLKTFIGWCFKSLYQGTIILVMGIYMFEDEYFVKMVTISFSCLILTEFLNVYSELHSVHIVMIISQICSVIIYFMSIICMPLLFDLATIDGVFIWKMIIITVCSWFPFHLFKICKRYIDPSDHEKIMKGVQKKMLSNI